MRKVILTFFLLVIPVAAMAEKQQDQDQRNIYDSFRDLLKPSAGVTLEEDVTSRIKRHMANLLYPVELSSFVRPEKDPKFREPLHFRTESENKRTCSWSSSTN
jgi:hypothetical protein